MISISTIVNSLKNMCLAWDSQELLFKRNDEKGFVSINGMERFEQESREESNTVINFRDD